MLGIGLAIGIAAAVVSWQVSPPASGWFVRRTMIVSNVAYWLTWSALALAVIALGRRLPLTGPRKLPAFLVHCGASLVFGVIHSKLWTLAVALWRTRSGREGIFSEWLLDYRWLTRWQIEWEITMYWALVGVAHALAFRDESRARALAAAKLDAELSQARLQALQQQMRPHFLFNTLQSISALMHHDVKGAELMIERLGEMLRASLRENGSGLVTVAQELDYVGHYLAIEQLNLGDRLSVRQVFSADALECRIPELLLQPLVENAVRHGIAPAAPGGTVSIEGRCEGPTLELTISDNGVGMRRKQQGSGIALANTRRRLDLVYPDQHTFEVVSEPDAPGVTVRIVVPAVPSGQLDSTPIP